CLFSTPLPSTASIPSLHDALPIYPEADVDRAGRVRADPFVRLVEREPRPAERRLLPVAVTGQRDPEHIAVEPERTLHVDDVEVEDRKSTRLNSSHEWISYAVFCLK